MSLRAMSNVLDCVSASIDGDSAVKSIVPVSVKLIELFKASLFKIDGSGIVIVNCTKAPKCCISNATQPFSGVEILAAIKSYAPI